jgi:hypothetical protein
MKIVRSAPEGVRFGDSSYSSSGNNFVLFWNRQTKQFLAGCDDEELRPVDNPEFRSAENYSEAKAKAEKFFALVDEGAK